MPFEVVPAIDVAAGRLARVGARGVETAVAFGGDPLAAATSFVAAGARRLHLVDLDLARTGEPANLDVLRAVAALGVPVQASGGVRGVAQVEWLLDAGAERVVLGSAAFANRDEVERALERFGDRVVLGIEAEGSTIRPRGTDLELAMWDVLRWLGGLDVPRFLLTEVGRVGELAGPDLEGVWALATHTRRPVLAAGGVRGVEDLRALVELGPPVEGAVVGRALFEGLDLRAALAAVATDERPSP